MHAGTMSGGPLDLWNHWSIQILVLLSLALQIFLFVFARIRRRGANPVLRMLLWLAYMQADSTAIYALGHLALSKARENEKLVAFWAPFLLLHLGGPDSISAYALQDNQLWLRHLQVLVVQVLGAGYVLYKRIADNGFFVMVASILMFTVGFVKYVERTWALKRGNMDTIRSSLKNELHVKHHQFHTLDQDQGFREGAANREDERYVRLAHSMFHVCKHAIVDSWIEKDFENRGGEMLRDIKKEEDKGMWMLMEVELSLLYDILYTKAAVIHTWPGYSIRIVSPLATVASFLLFYFSDKDGDSKVDVGITYTLLSGAFLLELTSLLSALGSSWTYTFLCTTRWRWLRKTALCSGRWDQLRQLVKKITRIQVGGQARRWSGEMGQYNMLQLCSRRETAFSPLLGRLAKMVGQNEWWNRKHYSGTIQISDELRLWLHLYIKRLPRKNNVNTQGMIRTNWGVEALQFYKCYDDFKDSLGIELQEGIIIWHIGTDVFLAESSRDKAYNAAQEEVVKTIRTLSNYMMFLIVERPDMLPGLAQTRLYQQTCQNLVRMWCNNKCNAEEEPSSRSPPTRSRSPPTRTNCSKVKELFWLNDDPNTFRLFERDNLATLLYKKQPRYSTDVPRLCYANWLTDALLKRENKEGGMAVLELIRRVWTDFLVYTANRCSRESHAKRLGSGGELTTVLWLMADYFHKQSVLSGDR